MNLLQVQKELEPEACDTEVKHMSDSVLWDDSGSSRRPVPADSPRVHNTRPGSRRWFRLLGPPRGVWLHWVPSTAGKGRSAPHLADGCPHCQAGLDNLRWKGYAPAERLDSTDAGQQLWSLCIVELTEASHASICMHFEGEVVWRGLRIELTRGPVGGPKQAELPPAWDIKPTLIRMWQIREPVLPSQDDAAGDHRAILDRVHRTALDKANRKWWKQNRPASMKEGAD